MSKLFKSLTGHGPFIALFGGAVVCTTLFAVVLWAVFDGNWSPERQEQQLNILLAGMLILGAGFLLTLVAFYVLGPLGKAKIKAGNVEIEAVGDGEKNFDPEPQNYGYNSPYQNYGTYAGDNDPVGNNKLDLGAP